MGENKEFLLSFECQVVTVVRVLEEGKIQHFIIIIVD